MDGETFVLNVKGFQVFFVGDFAVPMGDQIYRSRALPGLHQYRFSKGGTLRILVGNFLLRRT